MTLSIDPAGIKETDRIRRDLGDIKALADSIEKIGLLHPIVIDDKKRLIAGSRRLAAMRLLNRKTVPVTIITNLATAAELLIAERDENTCRKDFQVMEALALQDRLAKIEKPKAKARQRDLNGRSAGSKLEQAPTGKVRHITAKPTGFGATTLDKARKVVETAHDPNEDPRVRAIAEAEIEHMDAGGSVDGALRTVEQAHLNAQVEGLAANLNRTNPAFRRNRLRLGFLKAFDVSRKKGAMGTDADEISDAAFDDDLFLDIIHSEIRRHRQWCDDVEAALNNTNLATVTEIQR